MIETQQEKQNTALVTGGSGFIGKHLINTLLERGFQVSCLDRFGKGLPPQVKFVQADIMDRSAVKEAVLGQNYVYHLAGVLGTEELQDQDAELMAIDINVKGAVHVYHAAMDAREAGADTKVILISKTNPWKNVYSATKEASEYHLKMRGERDGLPYLIVKWMSVYGPGQKHFGVQKAVPTFIMRALNDEPIPVFGDGEQTADFLYVSDTVETTVQLAEMAESTGRTIEIGTGVGTPIKELAESIIRLCNSSSKVEHLPMRDGEDPNTEVIANLDELKKLIPSYSPRVSFEDGMRRTVAYYQKLHQSLRTRVA